MTRPSFVWSEDDECWTVHHGDIVVKFFQDDALREDEQHVLVTGILLSMEISYDSITEEKGILFKPQERWRKI